MLSYEHLPVISLSNILHAIYRTWNFDAKECLMALYGIPDHGAFRFTIPRDAGSFDALPMPARYVAAAILFYTDLKKGETVLIYH